MVVVVKKVGRSFFLLLANSVKTGIPRKSRQPPATVFSPCDILYLLFVKSFFRFHEDPETRGEPITGDLARST